MSQFERAHGPSAAGSQDNPKRDISV